MPGAAHGQPPLGRALRTAAGANSIASAYYSAPAEAGGRALAAADFDLGGADVFGGAGGGGFGGAGGGDDDESQVEDMQEAGGFTA